VTRMVDCVMGVDNSRSTETPPEPVPDISRPFAGLSPEVVLDAAAEMGFEGDGYLFALNSYENRVYQLGRGANAKVLKFYRPKRWSDAQIAEEHAFAEELARAELSVAAPIAVNGTTLVRFRGFRGAAVPWLPGRAPELAAPSSLESLGRALARIHQIGALRRSCTRARLGIDRLGWQARHAVIVSGMVPDALVDQYARASGLLLERVANVFESTGPLEEVRIHGDCHLGNLLWDEHGPVFVDLDDCVMGPRIQDLWMLLSGPPEEQQRQWEALIGGYQQFADFDYRELRWIEPLRALRM